MPVISIESFTEVLKASDQAVRDNWRSAIPIKIDWYSYQNGADSPIDVPAYDLTELTKQRLPEKVNYFSYRDFSDCDPATENCVDVKGLEDERFTEPLLGNKVNQFTVEERVYFESLGINTLRVAPGQISAITSNSFDWQDSMKIYVGDSGDPIVEINGGTITTLVDVTINASPSCVTISAEQGYNYLEPSVVPQITGPSTPGSRFVYNDI